MFVYGHEAFCIFRGRSFLSSFELCGLEISHLATSSQKDFARDAASQTSCAVGATYHITKIQSISINEDCHVHDHSHHGLIKYKDTKTKCRHL